MTTRSMGSSGPDQDIYVVAATTEVWIEAFLPGSGNRCCGGRSQILKSLDPFITRRMQETYLVRKQFTTSRDKATRAIQGRMSMGKVYLPAEAPLDGGPRVRVAEIPLRQARRSGGRAEPVRDDAGQAVGEGAAQEKA